LLFGSLIVLLTPSLQLFISPLLLGLALLLVILSSLFPLTTLLPLLLFAPLAGRVAIGVLLAPLFLRLPSLFLL